MVAAAIIVTAAAATRDSRHHHHRRHHRRRRRRRRARAVDAPGAKRSPLVQAMIEAGFARAQADEALTAVGAKATADVPKAMSGC